MILVDTYFIPNDNVYLYGDDYYVNHIKYSPL